jgi:hypothetical protein
MHQVQDNFPWIEARDGEVFLSYWLSSAGPLPEEFLAFLADLLDESNSDEHVFMIETPLSNIVDGLIDSRRYVAHSDQVVFGNNDKPMVDATRNALRVALEKLDAIRFTDE